MSDNVMDDIRQVARDFDIHSIESETEAAQFIDEMSGDQDFTAAEDMPIPDISFADAQSAVDGSTSDAFKAVLDIANGLLAAYTTESKKVSATQDHRILHAQMAMGVENFMVRVSEYLTAARERVESATSEEKLHLGVVKRVVSASPVVDETLPSPQGPSASVRSNTKAAQAFLGKNYAPAVSD